MKIAIIGTGGVGQAFATRLTGLGHSVTMGTRDVVKTKERLADFLSKNPGVKLATFADAAAEADLALNASKGEISLDIMQQAEKGLKGKILVDISNPLDFSNGLPPSMIPHLSNTTSLGEEIQKKLPDTKVVKTLNTMWNGIMINPDLIGDGNHVNYICGNDAGAKSSVISLLKELGWKEASIVDLGDITGARATEATLPIWLRVYGAKKTGAFNFSIVS